MEYEDKSQLNIMDTRSISDASETTEPSPQHAQQSNKFCVPERLSNLINGQIGRNDENQNSKGLVTLDYSGGELIKDVVKCIKVEDMVVKHKDTVEKTEESVVCKVENVACDSKNDDHSCQISINQNHLPTDSYRMHNGESSDHDCENSNDSIYAVYKRVNMSEDNDVTNVTHTASYNDEDYSAIRKVNLHRSLGLRTADKLKSRSSPDINLVNMTSCQGSVGTVINIVPNVIVNSDTLIQAQPPLPEQYTRRLTSGNEDHLPPSDQVFVKKVSIRYHLTSVNDDDQSKFKSLLKDTPL